MHSDNMGTSVLPQRQENAGFAAVVARGGGPGCHGKHLSQGTASSWASATAGKYGIRCHCGKGRRTGVPREAPLAGHGQFRGFRNGRKIRVPLPLWQGVEDLGGPGSASRKERPVPGLPQRQENTGFAAIVARGGEDRRAGMPQGTGNRSGRKGWRTEEIWNGGTSWSFLPKGLRRPHPRNLPYGDERSQNIHQEHSSRHDSSDHQYGQRP